MYVCIILCKTPMNTLKSVNFDACPLFLWNITDRGAGKLVEVYHQMRVSGAAELLVPPSNSHQQTSLTFFIYLMSGCLQSRIVITDLVFHLHTGTNYNLRCSASTASVSASSFKGIKGNSSSWCVFLWPYIVIWSFYLISPILNLDISIPILYFDSSRLCCYCRFLKEPIQ